MPAVEPYHCHGGVLAVRQLEKLTVGTVCLPDLSLHSVSVHSVLEVAFGYGDEQLCVLLVCQLYDETHGECCKRPAAARLKEPVNEVFAA